MPSPKKLLLTPAVDCHPRLLLNRFDRHKAQMWPLHGFANGGGIGGVVFAPFATESIRRNELRRDQTHLVAHGQ